MKHATILEILKLLIGEYKFNLSAKDFSKHRSHLNVWFVVIVGVVLHVALTFRICAWIVHAGPHWSPLLVFIVLMTGVFLAGWFAYKMGSVMYKVDCKHDDE